MLTIELLGNRLILTGAAGPILDIEETSDEKSVTMVLRGKLVSETSHPLQDELEAFVSVGNMITLDFKEVTYISPSVMSVLLDAQMLADNYFSQSEIVLKKIPTEVYRALSEAGVSNQLIIED